MKTIELNPEEAQVLLNLIDIAVKSAGLHAAQSAAHFLMKINNAPEKPVEEPAADIEKAPEEPTKELVCEGAN